MSIAEKLTTIAENQQKVYDAGYTAGQAAGGGAESILQYVSNSGEVNRLFYRSDFKGTDEIKVEMPNSPTNLSEMFAFAVGIRKIVLDVPITQTYNGYRLVYGGSDMIASVEELLLPDGIKFSNFSNFARYALKLKTISGRIDLSECTEAPNPFQNCTLLEDVSFMPNSIPLSISFANSSDLSEVSIDSIVKGLADMTAGEQQTITLHSTVVDKLTDEQMTAILNKNWITG